MEFSLEETGWEAVRIKYNRMSTQRQNLPCQLRNTDKICVTHIEHFT